MTREIKFRAWDSLDRKMIYDITQTKQFSNIDGGYDIIGFDSYLDDGSDTVIMQYTGLKDKNGKKIFEGDIISCQLFCPESNNCWITNSPIVVEWEEYGYDPFIEYGAPDHSFLVEIVGNIYENPELIGGDND